jgi:hypothetical protein
VPEQRAFALKIQDTCKAHERFEENDDDRARVREVAQRVARVADTFAAAVGAKDMALNAEVVHEQEAEAEEEQEEEVCFVVDSSFVLLTTIMICCCCCCCCFFFVLG